MKVRKRLNGFRLRQKLSISKVFVKINGVKYRFRRLRRPKVAEIGDMFCIGGYYYTYDGVKLINNDSELDFHPYFDKYGNLCFSGVKKVENEA